ncbi:MAG: iron ABC transporter permease [Candidatus Saelkia tenebricola]|nr:iron ABC transporter permease [Candidatus Saelkia tenebricola]
MFRKTILLFLIVCYLAIIFFPAVILFFEKTSAQYVETHFFNIRVVKIFFNTVMVGFLSSLLAVIMGVIAGYMFEMVKVPGKKIFFPICLMPLFIPPYISAIAWTKLLGSNGVINNAIMELFNLSQPLFAIYNPVGLIFVLSLSFFPFALVLTISGIRSLNFHLIEAARLTVRESKILRGIILPSLKPYIFAAFLLVFVLTMSSAAAPELLRVSVYALEVCVQFAAYNSLKNAMLISLPMIFFTVLLGFLLAKFLGKRPIINFTPGYRVMKKSESRSLRLFSFFFFSFTSFILLLPFTVLIRGVGTLGIFLAELKMSWPEIINSIFLAVLGASFTVIFALVICGGIIYLRRSALGKVLNITIFIPLAISGPIYALGLIKIFNASHFGIFFGTFIPLICLSILRFHPYLVRILVDAMRGIKKEITEAAYLVRANAYTRFCKIVVPLLKPFVLIAWFFCFLLIFQELSGGILLTPPGESTLAMRIEVLMHYGAYERVASLCLMEIFIPLFLLLLIFPFVKIKS